MESVSLQDSTHWRLGHFSNSSDRQTCRCSRICVYWCWDMPLIFLVAADLCLPWPGFWCTRPAFPTVIFSNQQQSVKFAEKWCLQSSTETSGGAAIRQAVIVTRFFMNTPLANDEWIESAYTDWTFKFSKLQTKYGLFIDLNVAYNSIQYITHLCSNSLTLERNIIINRTISLLTSPKPASYNCWK